MFNIVLQLPTIMKLTDDTFLKTYPLNQVMHD